MTVDVRGKKNLELGVKSKLLFFNYIILSSTVNMLYYGNKYFLRKGRFTKYFGGFK